MAQRCNEWLNNILDECYLECQDDVYFDDAMNFRMYG